MTGRDQDEPDPPAGQDNSSTPDAAEPSARLHGALTWLPASPALVALVGAALPWFAPTGSGNRGALAIPQAYCWQAGRIGYFAPLLLLIVAVSILGPRHGWFGKSAAPRTFTRDGRLLVAGGLVAGAVLALTWILLPKSYSFSGVSWDTLVAVGYHLQRNPQPGYFLAAVAALDAVACGIVYLTVARRESRDEQPDEAGKIENHDGEGPGR